MSSAVPDPRLDPSAPACWVYILENASGRFYIGSTDNPQRRLSEHNSDRGHCTFTHKYRPWSLVWTEEHPTRSAAMEREKQIKAMKSAVWIRRELLNR
jgi:putative endonuclease